MEYTPIIVGFASAVIAIIGNTWNNNAVGLKKLTIPGRLTFALVVVALIFSLFSTYQQRNEKQNQESDKKILGTIINTEIMKSLGAITSPFRALYIENTGGNYIPEKEITYDLMLSDLMIEKAQNTCLDLKPKTFSSVPDSSTWRDMFRSGITIGIDRLDRLIDRYGLSMNTEMLDAIHDLQVNGYLSGYAYTNIRRKTSPASRDSLPPCVIGQAIGSHKQYLTMLKKIESLNASDKLVR